MLTTILAFTLLFIINVYCTICTIKHVIKREYIYAAFYTMLSIVSLTLIILEIVKLALKLS